MFDVIEPADALKKYVKSYFIVEINGSTDFMPRQRIYPYGNVTVVYHYGSPSKFKKKGAGEYIEPNFAVCGQQTSYYDLSLSGSTGMIIVVFKPHGFKPFFNIPINELSDENLSLQEIVKYDAVELEDKLSQAGSNKERIRLLEDYLIKKLFFHHDFERVEHAIKIIEGSKGQIKTKALAHEVCWGIKQFERTFSKYVGLNPKKFMSIVRFQNVIQMKRDNSEAKMYQLAYDSGYYDQSHFNNDFKSLTGIAPRKFFKDKE